MADIVRDLEALQASSARGFALAHAAAQFAPHHIGLILGLHNISTVLTRIGYLQGDDVAWPPHSPADLYAEAWSQVGLDEEACKLLPYLPYTGDEETDPDIIAPNAKALDYRRTPGKGARDPRSSRQEHDLLPPQYLCLTVDPGGELEVLIYDTIEGRVGWWDTGGSQPKTATNAMRDLVWQSPELLTTYAQRMQDLEWLPDPFTMAWHTLVAEPAILSLEGQKISSQYSPSQWDINAINYFRACQLIYREHGWPGTEYGKEQAQEAFEDLSGQMEAMERALSPHHYHPDTDREPAKALTEFLRDAAGADAITSPNFEQYHQWALEKQSGVSLDEIFVNGVHLYLVNQRNRTAS